MLDSQTVVQRAGFDELALKPREVDLRSLTSVPIDRVTIDYEGPDAVPEPSTLAQLAERAKLRMTIPVRADGFDPLGDDRQWDALPADADVALVAGNPAYLSAAERRRAIAPRLAEALVRTPEAWVGTEGIERVAMATGAGQFELLGPDTERRVRALRAVGFDGDVAVYAPTVLAGDDDTVLDALGSYAARRRPVAAALPDDAPTDAAATGRAREVLLAGCADYGIVGDLGSVRARIEDLRSAGVDHVVGYPPRGLAAFGGDASASD